MTRRIHVIRHVAFEDLGLWGKQLSERGHVTYLQAGIDDLSICIHQPADLLVVLGGPIGVYESDEYPFLKDELRVIRDRLDSKKPMLGICLGAQLIAAAAGVRVYPSGVKEIGWAPIKLTDDGESSCLRHLQSSQLNVLHWHGDTFDLPDGAKLLASTELVKNQAFSMGSHLLAFQFHVEADPAAIESWLIGHTCELGGAHIKPSELRKQTSLLPAAHSDNANLVLAEWLGQAFT